MMRNKVLDRRRLGRVQTRGMFSTCRGLTGSTHCGAAMDSDVHRVMWSDDARRPVPDLPVPADRHAGCGPAIFLGLFEHEPGLDYVMFQYSLSLLANETTSCLVVAFSKFTRFLSLPLHSVFNFLKYRKPSLVTGWMG